MMMDVPPKETEALNKPFNAIGNKDTIARPTAPMKMMCVKIPVKYSLVG